MEQPKVEPAGLQPIMPATAAARIIVAQDGDECGYSMFDVRELSAGGAFLAGPLLLELNEEFTVEITLGDDRVRTRARVSALDQGDPPGMIVVFGDLSDGDRAILEGAKGAATAD